MSSHLEVAVITGAWQGISAGLVKVFWERSDSVVANSRAIQSHASPRVLTLSSDVADPKTADRIVSRAIERFGHIDTLTNNVRMFWRHDLALAAYPQGGR
jgi:NAD(P)-dependent dehydrogenase (short-subunit alcohol dehydrogenase family)